MDSFAIYKPPVITVYLQGNENIPSAFFKILNSVPSQYRFPNASKYNLVEKQQTLPSAFFKISNSVPSQYRYPNAYKYNLVEKQRSCPYTSKVLLDADYPMHITPPGSKVSTTLSSEISSGHAREHPTLQWYQSVRDGQRQALS